MCNVKFTTTHPLQNEGHCWSQYGQLIDNTKTMLKREANMTTYHLAKTTIQQSLEQIWIEDYPILSVTLYMLNKLFHLDFLIEV